MKTKLTPIVCALVVGFTALSLAFGQHAAVKGAKLPPGVHPSRWKALGDDFGVEFQVEGGAIRGQFMIRVDGFWQPLLLGPMEGIKKLTG